MQKIDRCHHSWMQKHLTNMNVIESSDLYFCKRSLSNPRPNLRGLFKLYGSKIQMKTYIWCKLLIASVMCICCFMWKCQDCAYLYLWSTENIWDIEIKLTERCYHTTGNVKIVSHRLSQDGLVYRQMVGEFYTTMILQIVIICDMNVCVNYW